MNQIRLAIFDEPDEPEKRPRRTLPKHLTAPQECTLIQFARDQLARARIGTRRMGPNKSKIAAAERDLFVVLLGLGTGLRLAELCDLRIEHIDLASQRLLVDHGKGDKQRVVPIPDDLIPSVQAWIGARCEGYLIPRGNGKRFSDVTMYWRVRRLGSYAGLPFGIHPHVFRHSFATRVWEVTRDLLVVQRLLGHASPTTAQIYTHCSTVHLLEAVNKLPKR